MKYTALTFSCALLCLSVTVNAQQVAAFPPEAKVITGDAVKVLVNGKTFSAQPATGNAWKVQYRDNGYAYLDVANGFRDSGKWRVDGNKLCVEWQRLSNPVPCNEVREMAPGSLVLLSGSGALLFMKAE